MNKEGTSNNIGDVDFALYLITWLDMMTPRVEDYLKEKYLYFVQGDTLEEKEMALKIKEVRDKFGI